MGNGAVPEFLNDALKFGINLGLTRMNELDRRLGDPQKNLKVVHIAGTNGKGSTVAFLSTILAQGDLKVGVYTSPYLERFSERMRIIDGREGLSDLERDESLGEIPEEDLNRLGEEVRKASDEMVAAGFEHPTEFELVTAICYLWFAEQNVDVAVLETGLGGRLDSTNVFEHPLATIITSIGFDHQDRLGNTISEIASEKAGIFKTASPAYATDPRDMLLEEEYKHDVRRTLLNKADKAGAPLEFVHVSDETAAFTTDGKMLFECFEEEYETSLLGRHQVHNAALAIKVAKDVFGLEQDVIYEGVRRTKWKGRCELIHANPEVILDGGHNVQCAQSLTEVLSELKGGELRGKKMRVLMGVMADKNVGGMIRTFKDGGINIEELILVKVNNPRSMDPDDLYNLFYFVYNSSIKAETFDDARKGAAEALKRTLSDGIPLLVTGSLYLIGEVRGTLCTTTDNLH